MLRAAAESLGLFLLPFVVYALYLVLRLRYPLEVEHWTTGRVSTMAILGLLAALAGFVALDLFAPRNTGAYVPAHIENGVLVPGHFE